MADASRGVLDEADRPIKAVTIASRASRDPHSYFRSVLHRIVEAREVRRMPGNRYWLVGRELPGSPER